MRLVRASLVGMSLAYLALTSEAAEPTGWVGFYKPTPPAPSLVHSADSTVCLSAIFDAQLRHNIPDNLLLAIGIQEAGREVAGRLTVWPWTANTNGQGAFFESKAALEAYVRNTQADGIRSIDVGCMQVNQRWHADQFASLEQATDPLANADYAARFLRTLYQQTGDWWEAAGRYHSSTQEFKDIYLQKLAQNHRLANAQLESFQVAGSLPSGPLAEQEAQPSFNWSAEMTGSAATSLRQIHSIYTATPLRPVLPGYAEAN